MIETITSPDLRVPHAFFTRRGGASSGIFAGLNCGVGSSDQAEVVAINRRRAAAALEAEVQALATVHQIHSARVETLTAPPAERVQADAMVTAVPGVVLGILTADCQPVLLADAEARVIAAAHAGWRGARDGVLEATVDAMVAAGARRDRITAVIGPTISQAAYEVGPDFMQDFLDDDPANARFFVGGPQGRPLFDLPAYGLSRLRAAGVGQALWTGQCTYRDPDRFYSYRRATHAGEADYGRLLSAIRL